MLTVIESAEEQLQESVHNNPMLRAPSNNKNRSLNTQPRCWQVCELLKDFKSEMPKLINQSEAHLQEFFQLFHDRFQFPMDYTRLTVADPYISVDWNSVSFIHRLPLMDFIETVIANPDRWDQSREWLALDQAGYVPSKNSNWSSISKEFGQQVGGEESRFENDTIRVFTNSGLPLREELADALHNLVNEVEAALPEESEEILENGVENVGLLYETWSGTLQGIQESIQAFRTLHLPLSRADVIAGYNHYLERFVQNLNAHFQAHGYGVVDFKNIQIPEDGGDRSPIAAPEPTGPVGTVTTIATPTGEIRQLNNGTNLLDRLVAVRKFLEPIGLGQLSGPFRQILNRELERRFGVSFIGSGISSAIFRASVPGVGPRLLRLLLPPEQEANALQNVMMGRSFDPKTFQQNPNLAGRTLVYAEIGRWMQQLMRGSHSPTFDAAVLGGADGQRAIAMTSVGEQSLLERLRQPGFTPTEEMLESSTLAQLFNYVVGQTDNHPGNYLVDKNRVRCIDPGLTFPILKLGKNNEDTVQNFAQALREREPSFSEFSLEECVDFVKRNKICDAILVQLPPLTQEMKTMLEIMVSKDSRKKFSKLLWANNFTKGEIDATMDRLDVLEEQLRTVQIVGKGDYANLWNRTDSPLTPQNCLLRNAMVRLGVSPNR
jgi:hypothetical protein